MSEQPFTILVVDDEPPICDILTRLAKKEFPEAQFINTRSAGETFEYLDKHSNELLRLVLLDINLHQAVDGLELLPQLRSRLKGKVPIIMFSSTNEKTDVRQAYEEGAIAYTQKPDDLQGWRDYISTLRTYWYSVNLLPPAP